MLKQILSVQEMGILIVLIILAVIFQTINPVFLSLGNIAGMLRAMSYTGIIAVGLALCLISGTIDISVGAMAGMASVVFSILIMNGVPIWISTLSAIVIGILGGMVNALAIVKLKISPFITTISTLYVFRGIAYAVSKGFSIYPLPKEVGAFGSTFPMGLSWAFLIMMAVMAFGQLLLDRSIWGLRLRATGSDYEAAECTEVYPKQVQTSALIIVGGLAGLAGVLVTTILGAGQPTAGTGWELIAIAGCAIGGVSLFGYEGSMYGLFLGLLTLQVISNGIVTIGVPPYFQNIFIGIILIASMIFDVRRRYYMNIEQF
jgi:ribose transport system permease protein